MFMHRTHYCVYACHVTHVTHIGHKHNLRTHDNDDEKHIKNFICNLCVYVVRSCSFATLTHFALFSLSFFDCSFSRAFGCPKSIVIDMKFEHEKSMYFRFPLTGTPCDVVDWQAKLENLSKLKGKK